MRLKINAKQQKIIYEILDSKDSVKLRLIDVENNKSALEYFYALKNKIIIRDGYIESDKESLSELREIVANYLMASDSFDINYVPNEKGLIIESLIDLFNVN